MSGIVPALRRSSATSSRRSAPQSSGSSRRSTRTRADRATRISQSTFVSAGARSSFSTSPSRSAGSGSRSVPRVDDLAVLVFVGGDLNSPVVLGFLYDEQTRPPDSKASELVYKVPDDAADDDRRIEVQLPSGNKLTLQDKKLTVTMGGTTLTVEADGAITLDAAGDLKLKAGGAVSIEAGNRREAQGRHVGHGRRCGRGEAERRDDDDRWDDQLQLRVTWKMPGAPVSIGCSVVLTPARLARPTAASSSPCSRRR